MKTPAAAPSVLTPANNVTPGEIAMPKPQLNTSVSIPESFEDMPLGSELRVPLNEKLNPVVKKNALVPAYGLIAQNPAPGAHSLGNLHSPMDAKVVEVSATEIILQTPPPPKEGEEAPAIEPVAKSNLAELSGDELCAKLKELGVNTTSMVKANVLVINALNPEPGVTIAEQMLKSEKSVLSIGLGLIERIMSPSKIFLVTANGAHADLPGCTMVKTSSVYPATLDPMVMKAATGSESPADVIVLPLQLVHDAGRVGETQLPLIDAIMTAGQKNYRVPLGTPLKDVLAKAGIAPADGDKIVLGGPMQGAGVFNLEAGAPKDCRAINVVPKAAYPLVTDNACTNCGECVLVCPARIRPNMITRYAEFKMYDKALKAHIDACFECGMCDFVCTANRPMLQYIRLAKQELVAQELMLSSCRLD